MNKYSQKYFPCVSKTFPVLQQNSLCFPCLEKVRTKFPVFPVPWPPWSCITSIIAVLTLTFGVNWPLVTWQWQMQTLGVNEPLTLSVAAFQIAFWFSYASVTKSFIKNV